MIALLYILSLVSNKASSSEFKITLLLTTIHYFIPYHLITDNSLWYIACIFSDALVLILSLFTFKKLHPLPIICCVLIWAHINAWKFGGHFQTSSYQVVAPILEHMQILSLLLFSNPVMTFIKESIKKCLHLP